MKTVSTVEIEEATMKYILNGLNMTDREAAYDEIVRTLPLPPYFGRNLDALWDVVSCMEGEIVLTNASAISGYGETILELLKEAAGENNCLTLTIQA